MGDVKQQIKFSGALPRDRAWERCTITIAQDKVYPSLLPLMLFRKALQIFQVNQSEETAHPELYSLSVLCRFRRVYRDISDIPTL